jgi:NMD protein affecting ribosome stability and mRNA decay
MDRGGSRTNRRPTTMRGGFPKAVRSVNVKSNAAKPLVRIRKSPASNLDPYIPQGGLREFTMCRICNALYHNKQWYLQEEWADRIRHMQGLEIAQAICPACRKIRDHSPAGVVTLEGYFLKNHQDEILRLIKNEERRAMGINPLERIIDLKALDNSVEVTTTTEKLAQRIGRTVHRAYSGELKFRWSNGVKLARVYWAR